MDRTLWFGPQIDAAPFQAFFSAETAHGTIRLVGDTLPVDAIEGELSVATLALARNGETRQFAWGATARPAETASFTAPSP